jgi:hypothetical protein
MSPFSNQDVLLLVSYRFEVVRQRTDLSLDRGNNVYDCSSEGRGSLKSERLAVLADIYYTVDVKTASIMRNALIRRTNLTVPDDLVRDRAHEI